MNVQITHVIVHTPEQVREIVAEAARIADEVGAWPEKWTPAFEQACTLLGARHTLALAPQGPSLDLGALGLNNRRH